MHILGIFSIFTAYKVTKNSMLLAYYKHILFKKLRYNNERRHST